MGKDAIKHWFENRRKRIFENINEVFSGCGEYNKMELLDHLMNVEMYMASFQPCYSLCNPLFARHVQQVQVHIYSTQRSENNLIQNTELTKIIQVVPSATQV